jgi:hypothetical protein
VRAQLLHLVLEFFTNFGRYVPGWPTCSQVTLSDPYCWSLLLACMSYRSQPTLQSPIRAFECGVK